MSKIKDEYHPRGTGSESIAKKRGSKAGSVKKTTRKAKSPRSRAIDQVAKIVERRMKPKISGPLLRPPKSVVIYSNDMDLKLQAGHSAKTCQTLPITWAIPPQRLSIDPADDRFRTSNDVYITGARIRFVVNSVGAYRIRMILYRPHHSLTPAAFEIADFKKDLKDPTKPGLTPDAWVNPAQVFKSAWHGMSTYIPNGPLATYNTTRSEGKKVNDSGAIAPPPAATYFLESADGTIFTADLAKGEQKPLATLTVHEDSHSNMGAGGTAKWKEIDWYVPIGETVHYENERSREVDGPGYQVLFYYDVPYVTSPKLTTIARIPQMTVKVYFR